MATMLPQGTQGITTLLVSQWHLGHWCQARGKWGNNLEYIPGIQNSRSKKSLGEATPEMQTPQRRQLTIYGALGTIAVIAVRHDIYL